MTEDTTQDTETTEDEAPDTVPVTDLDQFVKMLVAWHRLQVATVKHHVSIPEGTRVSIEGEPEFVLEGDVLRGFQMGLTVGLNYLGTLPFMAEYEDDVPTLH